MHVFVPKGEGWSGIERCSCGVERMPVKATSDATSALYGVSEGYLYRKRDGSFFMHAAPPPHDATTVADKERST